MITNRHQRRAFEKVAGEAALRTHDQAQAMAQQTIAVFLRMAQEFYGEPIPMDLINTVQSGVNDFAKAQSAAGLEFTWGKLEGEIVRLVKEWRAKEEARIEANINAAQAGGLPIL